jgi:RNA polymerase-binding transcription factor DksA
MAAKKSKNELRQAAWLARIMRSDEETWRSLVHLLGDLQRAGQYRIDKGKLAAIDARTDDAIREVRAGRLRGSRAVRKIDAINTRLSKMIAATYLPCPTCGESLPPERYAALKLSAK